MVPQLEPEDTTPTPQDDVGETQAQRYRGMARNWINLKGYKNRYRHETAADLHVGFRELLTSAETAQRLLDDVRIPDGMPQGDGDIDSRVAVAVLRIIHAEGFLSAIANAHDRERAGGGMVGDYCIECDRRWPCPTYQWANGDRDMNDSWEGSDDG